MLAADRLSAAKLRGRLGHCTIGREIIVLDETTSTNDVVLQMAHQRAREGLVVFAEHQTAGRGQRGKVWESSSGKGLLCSIPKPCRDRKSTRLNSSHLVISYAVFCFKKKRNPSAAR